MKVAVIGAGNIAEKHLEVLQAFSDVELAAICSRGHPRIDALADRFGIREKFNDYRKMLDTVSADAVFVLVSAMQIVPVAAECSCVRPAGRQCSTLKPYRSRWIASSGSGAKDSAAFSSMISTVPSGCEMRSIAASTTRTSPAIDVLAQIRIKLSTLR